ncbi:MAG: hypothetical protein WD295_00215 [Bacteroidota bacterium]
MDRVKIDWSFLKLVFAVFAAVGATILLPLAMYADPEIGRGVAAGAVMSLINFLLGFVAIEYAFEKPHTVFLKVLLGGMFGRLLAMAGVVVLLIKVFEFQALPLMLSLLGFYLLNLGLEITFLQKKVKLKH